MAAVIEAPAVFCPRGEKNRITSLASTQEDSLGSAQIQQQSLNEAIIGP